MKFIAACFASLCLGQLLPSASLGEVSQSQTEDKFRGSVAELWNAAEKKNAAVVQGADGWLFLTAELHLLSAGQFWGADAATANRSSKPEVADPIPAIEDFQQRLKQRGIDLLLVPVPPKAAIYPEKIVSGLGVKAGDPAPFLSRFYDELRASGIDVLDLRPLFLENRAGEKGPVFCKTDTHWSGNGCVLAAHAIAERIRAKLPPPQPGTAYGSEWKEVNIAGDLGDLLDPSANKPGPEKLWIRTVTGKATGAPVEPDPQSPVLVLGDSHTLVFHDFLAEKAGLIDQLAFEFGFAPDLIGIRGSGATQVRKDLYRRSLKNPQYLAGKKLILWCFTAREFTEAAQGWQKLPIEK